MVNMFQVLWQRYSLLIGLCGRWAHSQKWVYYAWYKEKVYVSLKNIILVFLLKYEILTERNKRSQKDLRLIWQLSLILAPSPGIIIGAIYFTFCHCFFSHFKSCLIFQEITEKYAYRPFSPNDFFHRRCTAEELFFCLALTVFFNNVSFLLVHFCAMLTTTRIQAS